MDTNVSGAPTTSSVPVNLEQRDDQKMPNFDQKVPNFSNQDPSFPKSTVAEKILSDYLLAYTEVPLCPDMLQKVISMHKHSSHGNEDDITILKTVFDSFQDLVLAFSTRSQYFQSLTLNDQKMLIENNAKMFLLYILARYFTSWTGMDQLNLLLGPNLPVLCK